MPGLEYVEGRYLVQFQPRTIDDILKLDDGRGDERAFEVVNRVSQINQGLYETFLSPVVKALSNEGAARVMRDLNPARMERWAFSDVNPWMWWVKPMADWVRANRQPVAPDNPFVQLEKKVSGQIEEALDRYRDARDAASERLFKALYESPWLSAAVGCPAAAASAPRARRPGSARSSSASSSTRSRPGSRPARWSTPGRGCFSTSGARTRSPTSGRSTCCARCSRRPSPRTFPRSRL